MPESTVADVLERQVESLQSQVKQLTSERDEAYITMNEISAERDSYKADALSAQAAVGKDQDRITELETERRQRVHLDRFSELVKAAGAKPGAVKHLWDLSKFNPEDDEPDEKALNKLVTKLKADVDYAFDAEQPEGVKAKEEQTEKQIQQSRIKSRDKYPELAGVNAPPPPGSGRGGRNNGHGDGTIITADMRGDAAFMLDPKNQEMINSAAREGRFR